AFIACTAISTSPWPVMKTMDTGHSLPIKRCCRARPLMVGMRMSNSRQPMSSGGLECAARKASALAYCTTFQPTDSSRKTTERRNAASSATRWIDRCCAGFMDRQTQRKNHRSEERRVVKQLIYQVSCYVVQQMTETV